MIAIKATLDEEEEAVRAIARDRDAEAAWSWSRRSDHRLAQHLRPLQHLPLAEGQCLETTTTSASPCRVCVFIVLYGVLF
jgi:hypothetical protein